MAFWNRWPYTTLQNLNLDWILKEIKSLREEGLTAADVKRSLNTLVGSTPETAKNADKLGGKAADSYATVNGTINNAENLGGLAASQYALRSEYGLLPSESVRFEFKGHLLIIARSTVAPTENGIYVATSYSIIRQPAITQISTNSGPITIATGGDNTSGWWLEITNSVGNDVSISLIGTSIPRKLE